VIKKCFYFNDIVISSFYNIFHEIIMERNARISKVTKLKELENIPTV